MAWIRIERKSTGNGAQYDAICETATDLGEAENGGEVEAFGKTFVFGPGSLCYCTGMGKLNILGSDSAWTEV